MTGRLRLERMRASVRRRADYGIADSKLPLQPRDDNLNIGASSLLGWALGLRPSKDILWTSKPANCRGVTADERRACAGKGAHSNPGSNVELNAIVATLSTGPVSLADKAFETNATIVSRCVRLDGRILQPDKPATAVDSMFLQPPHRARDRSGGYTGEDRLVGGDGVGGRVGHAWLRTAPSGMVWATSTVLARQVWHYVLSIDVRVPWRLHGDDLYPELPTSPTPDEVADGTTTNVTIHHAASSVGEGWMAHSWFTGHRPTECTPGSDALASGCVQAHVRTADELPPLVNARPIMVQNDTHVFDLLTLAPIVHGWVLLGEVGRYVRVSRDRFESVTFSVSGIRANITGSEGEVVELVALQPTRGRENRSWVVVVERVVFEAGRAWTEVAFGGIRPTRESRERAR